MSQFFRLLLHDTTLLFPMSAGWVGAA